MIDVATVRGPLDDGGLRRVGALYGAADPKYASIPFLRNLLVDGPAGPALHAFATAGGEAVGHCCVVPLPAVRGDERIRSGKVEALVLDERFRGVAVEGRSAAVVLLERLYALADEEELDVLHAYATPELGVLHRLLGFRALEVGRDTLVAALPGRELARRYGARAVAVGAGQALLRAPALRVAAAARARPPEPDDADLLETPRPARAWTVPGDELLEWYRRSGLIHVVEHPQRFRALVQTGAPGGSVQLLAWRAQRPGQALAALAACARFARRHGVATLRFQPWPGAAGDGGLVAAGPRAGLLRRRDLSTLYVRSRRPELASAAGISLNPFFYATF